MIRQLAGSMKCSTNTYANLLGTEKQILHAFDHVSFAQNTVWVSK